MKYSFMSFSTPGLDFDQILKVAKLYGYNGFEPRIDAGHKHNIESTSSKTALREAKLKAAEAGIKICCIATSCNFSNPDITKANIESAKRALDLAAEVEAPAIRVFGGFIPEGVSREKSRDLVINAMIKLAPIAADRNVSICIETHDSWCDPAQVADIVRNVNHPNVAVNWDIMHPVLREGYTIEKSFNTLKPWIKHVHVHDGTFENDKLELKPIGQGSVDHKAAINLLKDLGYNGFISGEWIDWEPYDIHLPREIATLKSYE